MKILSNKEYKLLEKKIVKICEEAYRLEIKMLNSNFENELDQKRIIISDLLFHIDELQKVKIKKIVKVKK